MNLPLLSSKRGGVGKDCLIGQTGPRSDEEMLQLARNNFFLPERRNDDEWISGKAVHKLLVASAASEQGNDLRLLGKLKSQHLERAPNFVSNEPLRHGHRKRPVKRAAQTAHTEFQYTLTSGLCLAHHHAGNP